MKTTRTNGPNSWKNIGRQCANLGWPIERALTGKLGFDSLIREGFNRQIRRNKRRVLREQQTISGIMQFDMRGLRVGKECP